MSTRGVNIKDELQKLAQIQEMDSRIYALTQEKNNIPKTLSAITEEFEAVKAKLKSLEDKKQKTQVAQKEKEVELAGKEENIKKSQGQLGLLKSNKEYQAKTAEISGFKADMSILEEQILKAMDDIEVIKREVEIEREVVSQHDKVFSEKKALQLRRSEEIEAELDQLAGKRKIQAVSVDKNILARYEHILHAKAGLALVKVAHGSCQGCFMSVPHQVINEIKMYENIIACGQCSRLLYLDEDESS